MGGAGESAGTRGWAGGQVGLVQSCRDLGAGAQLALGRSLTGGGGAVSRVVVNPVEFLAALGAEIQRAWTREKETAVRAAG